MISSHPGMRGPVSRVPEDGIAAPRAPSEPITQPGTLRTRVEWPQPGLVVVRLGGEIDLAALPRLTELLRQRLTAAHLDTLILDLTDVSYGNSAALELLLHVQRRADRRDIDVYIVPGSGPVARLLYLTGIADRFRCRDNTTDIIASLALDA